MASKTTDSEERARFERPLSFAQQRLWFLEQLGAERVAYNITEVLDIRGDLDKEALRRALQTIVERHESLRTTFGERDGRPFQMLQAQVRFSLPNCDLRHLAPEDRPGEVARRIQQQAACPFDLASDLMLRGLLMTVADDQFVLVLGLHHIAADGWSLQILWRELGTLYESYVAKRVISLPELPIQYAAFAERQRRELQGARLDRLAAYWRRQLDGLEAVELPADRPRPRRATHRGASRHFVVPPELAHPLQQLARDEGVTMHMALLAAFQTLLARYSGQQDIAVGIPVAGRAEGDLVNLIGFFVNTLVLRTDLSGSPSFRCLLGRVRECSLQAYEHQDLPFEELVEQLQPERNLSRSPLVQVVFQLLNFPHQAVVLADLDVTRKSPPVERVRFDLEMNLWQRDGDFDGRVDYSTDLFDAATIARIVDHFQNVLQAAVADPDQPVGCLPLMNEQEQQLVLGRWSGAVVSDAGGPTVHQLFQEQAARAPQAVAVECEDRRWTYAELNEQSNQWAERLRAAGVGPGKVAGLCLPRSPAFVIGVLAILKTGGAYLPLDVDDPPARKQQILEDASAEVLLTKRAGLSWLPPAKCRVIDCDEKLPAAEADLPAVAVSSADSAYIMYTSGSTGDPKGVVVSHRGITRLVVNTDYIQLTAEDCVAHVSNVAFDATTFEIFGPLLNGGRLAVAPPQVILSTRSFSRFLGEHGVTTLFLTTSLFNLHSLADPGMFKQLKQVLFGGETADAATVRMVLESQPPDRLLHVYGPTENTTFTTWYCVDAPPTTERVPIGRPLRNTQVYLLDEDRRPVPIGIPAELYIGGLGLAEGYFGRQDLTAERFLENPFGQGRLYRTGDLCCWRDDGNLEFLGRFDQQIKLRGFRIELTEIEAVLSQHPDVAQAVVILSNDLAQEKRLVAHVVPAAGRVLRIGQLKEHLSSRLPSYTVPAVIVESSGLPLTSSGKINRRLLAAAGTMQPASPAARVPPRNAVERELVAIWKDVLGLEDVGIDDNFFDLGGHSLLAVTLLARIERTTGQAIPLASLFQQGEIRGLAQQLAEPPRQDGFAELLELHNGGSGCPLVLMPGLSGELPFSLARAVIEQSQGQIPLWGIQPDLNPENADCFRDFRATAAVFVAALRAHRPHGPYALAGYSYGGFMAFEVARQLTELGEVVDLLAVIDTGPMLRGGGIRLAGGWRSLSRIAANLPAWLREESRQFSAAHFLGRVARKVRRGYRLAVSGGKADIELDDVFGEASQASRNPVCKRAAFAALREYEPLTYTGKLTLFRAVARPLLEDRPADLGWSQFAERIEVREIPGDHLTILRVPHAAELVRQLCELLSPGEFSGRPG